MAKKTTTGFADILNKYSAEREEVKQPTGLRVIDKIMGGGITPGSMYAAWGPQGSGKSTIALQICKSYCKRGEKVLWVDVEKALNQNQQESFGIRQFVEDGTFIRVTASTYAECDDILCAVATDPDSDIKFVVVDSESMLLTKIAVEQKVDDAQPGQKARQAAVMLTKAKSLYYDAKIPVMILFHARANISMTAGPYAPATKQAGGYAALHVPDLIIQIQPGQKFGDKAEPEGQIIHISADKNKFARPFQKYDAKLFFGTGIKKSVDLIDEAIAVGIIMQSGSFFKLPSGESVRGLDSLYTLPADQLREIQTMLNG